MRAQITYKAHVARSHGQQTFVEILGGKLREFFIGFYTRICMKPSIIREENSLHSGEKSEHIFEHCGGSCQRGHFRVDGTGL